MVKNYIIPRFGGVIIGDIEGLSVEDWLLSLSLSTQHRKHIKNVFSNIMDEAVRDKIISANPLHIIDLGRLVEKKQDVLTRDEVKILFPDGIDELLNVWVDHYRACMFLLMVTSGMRPSEIRALKWHDFLWDEKCLWIKRAVKENNQIGSTKNDSERSLYLPDKTITMFKSFKQISPFNQETDWIFYGRDNGTPISRRMMLRYLKEVIDSMFPNANKNITMRSIRHTYRTIAGQFLPKEMLKEQMGHKSDRISDRYDASTAYERLSKYKGEQEKVDGIFN